MLVWDWSSRSDLSAYSMAGTIIMSVTYGLEVTSKNDPYIVTAKQGVQPLSQAVVPGAFLVDAIPALKYVPSWMPFAGFQRKAREWRKLAINMQVVPYEAAKEQMVGSSLLPDFMLTCGFFQETGHICPSFVSRSLEKMDQSCDLTYQEHVIKSTAGTMYAGESLFCVFWARRSVWTRFLYSSRSGYGIS
jgi:hypothetical protein